MPRPAKGPRLWLQKQRIRPDGAIDRGFWVIRDGSAKRSTGISYDGSRKPPREAERALAEYIAGKHTPARESDRRAHQVAVADVINIYLTDKAPRQARPKEVAARCMRLIEWWGDKTLAQVTGSNCRAYAESRKTEQGARRELEDLKAAIRYHRQEGLCLDVVEVTLPPKAQPRSTYLTRSEAARLLWAAWRYREVQKGVETDRRTRRHVARFILVALYTGTRAGAVCQAALKPTEGAGWINLDNGVFYRKPEGERETRKRKGAVRMPSRLVAHIRRWKAKRICHRYVVEWQGRPVKDVDKAFRNVAADAGLSGVTPHCLRHTAATWLMQNGAHLDDAAQLLSMTRATLERTYWHHHPDFQRDAAERLGKRCQFPDRMDRNEREQTRTRKTNVIEI